MNITEILKEISPDSLTQTTIGALITKNIEKGKHCPEIKQVYVVSNTLGLVKAEDFRDKTVHSEDTSNYTVVREGMFAYNPARLNIGSIGVLKDEDGLVSPMYTVFSINKELIDSKYLEYLLKTDSVKNQIISNVEQGARFRFDFTRWDKIKVTIPSLENQIEIVKILDTFTELDFIIQNKNNLRNKQYLEYRYKCFEKINDEYYKMGDVCHIEKGKTQISKATPGKYPLVVTAVSRKESDTYQFDTEAVCIPMVSSRGHGVASLNHVFYQNGKFALGSILCAVIPNDCKKLNAKYLYYYLEETKEKTLVPLMKGGANVSLHLYDLQDVLIPIPSLKVQEKIVNDLDIFSKLNEDILPVISEKRKDQFNYYLNKLLTFDKCLSKGGD